MVDISMVGGPGETYPYVRLTDPKQRGCGGGYPGADLELSQSRAAAVRKYLESVKTVGAIETRGYGSTRPAAPNDTEEGREKNRRVELIVIPAPSP
jgi:hypothetical protein